MEIRIPTLRYVKNDYDKNVYIHADVLEITVTEDDVQVLLEDPRPYRTSVSGEGPDIVSAIRAAGAELEK
jgi:uncharacterized protein (DUF342 family)